MADDTYTVERSTTIDAPAERIYQHVANFHNWRSWSPWEGVDPDLRRTYSGPDTGPGATYASEGNRKAGAGRMEVVEAAEPGGGVTDAGQRRSEVALDVDRKRLERRDI